MPRYIGQSVRRLGDDRLLTGAGSYLDDLKVPGLLHLAIARSVFAHAVLGRVDLAAARSAPGVVAAFVQDDLEPLGPVPSVAFVPGMAIPVQTPLARGKTRFVGEPIAAVVADSRYQAEDAVRLVEVDYDPLPVLPTTDSALAPDAPRLHEELADNVAFRFEKHGGDVEAAFARAKHVVRVRARHGRVAAVPLEPRGMLVVPGFDELTVWAPTQGPHEMRMRLATALGMSEHRIRVIASDLGGGFGVKAGLYREELLVARAAQLLRRPVKWAGTRMEDFQGTSHARDQDDTMEAALDGEGHILGIRTRTVCNLGAYLMARGSRPPLRVPLYSSGAYRIRAQASEVVAVYTNTTPTGPYRGAGRPEAAFLIERLVETAAHELAMDPAELRRRNHLQPSDFPYTNATGSAYDSGNYPLLLEHALETADYPAWLAERERRRAAGEIVGIGLATFIENTAAGWETGTVRVEPDGSINAFTGAVSMGQGIMTALGQIVAEKMGVPFERVRVQGGDTALVPTGVGSFGSRSTAVGGSALALASDRVIERLLPIGAHLLEARLEDVEYVEGAVRVKGVPDRTVELQALAAAAHPGLGAEVPFEPNLTATASFSAPGESISSGAYLAMVSIDRETGRVTLERLLACDDSGVVVNPMLIAGQVIGAAAQGIGEVLTEQIVYDDDGQLLTSTLMDYALPTAKSVPTPILAHISTPSTRNPLGIKGAGEAGALGTQPAVVNAVADALWPLGVRDVQPPLVDEKVWRLIQAAG